VKIIKGVGEHGVVDQGSLLAQQDEPVAREQEGVFVAQARHSNGSPAYVSVHTSKKGAQQRVEEVAGAWGVALDQLDHTVGSPTAARDQPADGRQGDNGPPHQHALPGRSPIGRRPQSARPRAPGIPGLAVWQRGYRPWALWVMS